MPDRKLIISSGSSFQQSAMMVVIALLALLVGASVTVFTDIAGDRIGLLMALPVIFLLGLLFFFNRNFLFLLVILFRSMLDPIFNMTKFGADGSGVGVGGVLNALVIGLAAIELFRQSSPALSNLRSIWGPFVLVMIASAIAAPSFWGALKMNLTILSYAAIFILPLFLIKSKEDFSHWMKVVLWSSVIPVIYAFLELASGGGHTVEGLRIKGTFSHPNIFAFYLVLMILLLFSVAQGKLIEVSAGVRRLLPVFILLMLVLLVLTKTRSAWAACFTYFFFYGLLFERKVLIPVIMLPFLALAVPEVRDRLMDVSTGNEHVQYAKLDSYTWRKSLWTHAMAWMAPVRYVFGYGAGSFTHYSPIFFPLAGGVGWGAHSVYVQLFFEAGLMGILSFIWLVGSAIRRVKGIFPLDRVTAFTITMLLIEYAVVSYSDNMLDYLVFNWYFWFVVGATFALSAIEQKNISNPAINSMKFNLVGDRYVSR